MIDGDRNFFIGMLKEVWREEKEMCGEKRIVNGKGVGGVLVMVLN